MKTTKTTTTAFEIGNALVIGVTATGDELNHHTEFYVKLTERWGTHVTCYTAEEMKEIYSLTETQLLNMVQVLNR